MKFSCTKENLLLGLASTSHITNKGVDLPILNNVLMRAESGFIKLIATNLEIAISCIVRGKVEEVGEFTVPSKLLFDYINLIPEGVVEIQQNNGNIEIKSGNYNTKIKGLETSEFPVIPQVNKMNEVILSTNFFKKALGQVVFAASQNEVRPELSGVFINFEQTQEKGNITLAATDSFRLAEATIKIIKGKELKTNVIIPVKTLIEVSRIISLFKTALETPTEILINISDNQIVFCYDQIEIISRVIEGKYPDYKQIIPKTFNTNIVIEKEEAIKATRAASLFSKNELFDVNIKIDKKTNTVTFSSNNATRGENTVVCQAEIEGESNEVTLNYRYLIDGLNSCEEEKVLFQMIDSSNPCLLKPKSDKETNFQYLIMPIRQ